MLAKLNARNQIVEATDLEQGNDYTEIAGTVAENLPLGLLGFNGRVYTPNYYMTDGAVVERSEADKALDPRSDVNEAPSTEERMAALESAMLELILGGGV